MQPNKQYGRPDNKEKYRTFIRDSENTLQWAPNDAPGNRFIGNGYNFYVTMVNNMMYERGEKYTNKYNAMLKAETELQTMPKCFDQCIGDVTTGLNSVEKNCMRDCYFKRVSARDDMTIYFQQRLVFENIKNTWDKEV